MINKTILLPTRSYEKYLATRMFPFCVLLNQRYAIKLSCVKVKEIQSTLRTLV